MLVGVNFITKALNPAYPGYWIRQEYFIGGIGRFVESGREMNDQIIIADDSRVGRIKKVMPGSARKIVRAEISEDVRAKVSGTACY